MFCYQCEQTAHGTGCTTHGVCGKDPTSSALQELLVQAAKEIAWYARRAAAEGKQDQGVDAFVLEALFSTVTNVNFDPERLQELLQRATEVKATAQRLAGPGDPAPGELSWSEPSDLEALHTLAQEVSLARRIDALGAEAAGLGELALYGLKGAAAYADHARLLGYEDADLYKGFHALLARLAQQSTQREELLTTALEVGELNLRAMEILDRAHTETYGHPEPVEVPITPRKGKAILVSGHDMKDLHALLEQTKDTGINVYTHGEMLPAHGYPELRRFDHLVGNYGGAWQEQRREFAEFPGAILMTTNCIQAPKESYKDRIFTSGLVAWPGVQHIDNRDFAPVIQAALDAPGFSEDEPQKHITVGFGRDALQKAAGTLLEAIAAGDIRHLFLIGGCDGAKPGRNYYTDFARAVPDDCLILTLACGKYRFNKLQFGTVAGIPRLLDVGQCNDAYSAIRTALALADALDCGVNDLPLSLVLSWFEQKAVGILLTLLHLGLRDIRLGPSLPAFVAPEALSALQQAYDLKPISNPQTDLQAVLK
ncbi:MAG: hydroxylamine reductase [Candidatus Bipolaricaulota bacterium]